MKKAFLLFTLHFIASLVMGQSLTSSNLPIVVINTNGQEILNDPKVTADMGIVYNGDGVRNNSTDPFNHFNGKIGIEVRGQSSQQFPMKSYGFEVWNSTGGSVNQSFFGLPAESDWILYAPYNEKTLMHNVLAYNMSRELGHWASNTRFVELILNGDYRGIYVFEEKIKRNNGRVNISKLNPADIANDDVTGGYIFSIDKDANAWYSSYYSNESSGAVTRFSYVYPKVNSIAPEQKAYIKSYTDQFESALKSVNYQDKVNGWRKFADEASFIDYFLVNEVSKNVDGYRISSYFYKDKESKGGKIVAGPVWDYDLSFRNANYCEGSDTAGWGYRFNEVCSSDFFQVPFWWQRMMTDTAFQYKLRCRYKELRQTSLSTEHLNHLIDSIVVLTAEARARHFQRWPVLGQYVWPNAEPIPPTYEGEILLMKNWIADRLKWLDSNMPNTGPCADFPASVTESMVVAVVPNPIVGDGTLSIRSRIEQPASVTVFDAQGKRVFSRIFNLLYGYNSITLNAGSWPKGIYIVQVHSLAGEKFIVKALK